VAKTLRQVRCFALKRSGVLAPDLFFVLKNKLLQSRSIFRTFAVRFGGGTALRDSLINHSPAF
jgi:hypothetical protein